MGVARRRWSPDEKKTILQLAREGFTQKQIGEKLRPGVKNAWRTVGDIIRDERKKAEVAVAAVSALLFVWQDLLPGVRAPFLVNAKQFGKDFLGISRARVSHRHSEHHLLALKYAVKIRAQ